MITTQGTGPKRDVKPRMLLGTVPIMTIRTDYLSLRSAVIAAVDGVPNQTGRPLFEFGSLSLQSRVCTEQDALRSAWSWTQANYDDDISIRSSDLVC